MRGFIAEHQLPITLEGVYAELTPQIKNWFDQFVFVRPMPFDRAELLRKREHVQRLMADVYRTYQIDAMLLPATPFRAPKIGQNKIAFDGQYADPMDVIENTSAIGSVLGYPGVTLPIGGRPRNSDLPVAVELLAPAQSDRRLLAIATAVESVLDGISV